MRSRRQQRRDTVAAFAFFAFVVALPFITWASLAVQCTRAFHC